MNITHDWKIPKAYYRRFVLEQDGLGLRLTANGKTNLLTLEQRGDPEIFSKGLDWLTVCMEQIRMECDGPYRRYRERLVKKGSQ